MKKFWLFLLLCCSINAYADWQHKTTEDKMGRGSEEIASTLSLNDLNLSQPYDGAQKAMLSFRRLGNGGNEIVIAIQKGQIVCDAPECMVLIRPDEEKPFRISMNHPKDGSSNVLIGQPNTENLRRLMLAKKLSVEITIFQNGESIIEFNSANNPFIGRVVYTLDELREKIKQKKTIPYIKTGDIKIGNSGFSICKNVVKSTKNEGEITLISKETQDEFVSQGYSESSLTITSCKKGVKNILMEFYEYK